MATVYDVTRSPWKALSDGIDRFLEDLGDLGLFAVRVFSWLWKPASRGTLLPIFYSVGVRSIPVVAVTGMFIGMVLAVQAYGQFNSLGVATRLGSIVNMSVVR